MHNAGALRYGTGWTPDADGLAGSSEVVGLCSRTGARSCCALPCVALLVLVVVVVAYTYATLARVYMHAIRR